MERKSFNLILKLTGVFIFLYLGIAYSQNQLRFAVIGDFGKAGSNELAVADLVKSWNPDFIITVGDNNYENGEASTIDANIGQYYHEYINPYIGSYGQGADTNKFFPVPGNHDWRAANLTPYKDYFELPNNERYYDFTVGNIQFFMLDSDSNEPDGNSSSSTQADWFYNKIASSNSTWKIVCAHHPPYSSGQHGSNSYMQQWDFPQTGATTVLAGHDHTYERIEKNGFTYFVNGLGGKSLYSWGSIVSGSQVRYNGDYGAMLVNAYADSIVFNFIDINYDLIDSYTIINSPSFAGTGNIQTSFVLNQNYPNPFNPSTTISYKIQESADVSLKVYDVLGNEVATLVNEEQPAGNYEIEFNSTSGSGYLSSQVYFYQLKAGNYVQTKKMIFMK